MCAGVTHDIDQGFLGDAVTGHLDGSRKWRELLRCLQSERNFTATILAHLFAQGRKQP